MSGKGRRLVRFVGGEPARRAASRLASVAANMGLPWDAATTDGDANVIVVDAGAGEERWELPPGPDAAARVEAEVMDLVARLLGGRKREDAPPPAAAKKPDPPKKIHTVRVGRETAGRRGKGVTLVWDFPFGGDRLDETAATLKTKCGTGGTVKDGKIEIQGDQRDRVTAELEKMGYKVKRVGG